MTAGTSRNYLSSGYFLASNKIILSYGHLSILIVLSKTNYNYLICSASATNKVTFLLDIQSNRKTEPLPHLNSIKIRSSLPN